MAPDLPDKLLGIDIDEPDRSQQPADDADADDEEYVRVVLFTVGEHRLAVPVDAVRTTTDQPEEVTPVPRTPPAVEGVTDLRGEITAVIDPSIHFPTAEDAASDQLLVFDRPADEQSAAIRVDEVRQVESIAESDILDVDGAADRDLSTDVLDHPLVESLVVKERRPTQRLGETVVAPDSTDGSSDADGTATATTVSAAPRQPTVVEVTPLVDVDRLLLASGPETRAQTQ